jgi:transposase
MSLTALRFLARYGVPRKVTRLGNARLAEFFRRSSRGAWHHERAAAVIAAADATLRLWGTDGMDFDALAADIAVEARMALAVTDEIQQLDKRSADVYERVDPAGIVRSVPGGGRVGAPQITGRLGHAARFANLAAIRSFTGLVPHQDSSGMAARAGGPTKAGDACTPASATSHPTRSTTAAATPSAKDAVTDSPVREQHASNTVKRTRTTRHDRAPTLVGYCIGRRPD